MGARHNWGVGLRHIELLEQPVHLRIGFRVNATRAEAAGARGTPAE
jgi:hypothetical protein